MRATCPECGTQAHVAAFFVEDDGKRLAVIVATMPPDLGRATLAYLGLFKPAKTSLRIGRAAKIAAEVAELVATGSVCKDERAGVRRPASAGMWAAAMEQMVTQRAALSLPLESHGYLRAVVFGLADKADAASERQREADARIGKHLSGGSANLPPPVESKLQNAIAFIDRQMELGAITPEEAEVQVTAARAKYGALA
ncbi:hypothetical protein K6X13_14795 [Xanthomonas euvesicatoria pv. allii]|uniref:hypothetical protein n=1 Tax=Xanthomonas euvesicatoria TaxID=456327 RepID=UPI002404B591|nr:hypothetical protein [Xanthomonas euvesicatoria]MCP3048348.1 hypothetical protein [Xanthomonas euvesicatoria pv. allii]